MSFPRYPSYKDSGVEWLEQVPEHWEVKRARAVGVFSSSGIDKKLVEGEQSVQMFNYLDVYKSTDKILLHSNELMWTTTPAEKVVEHAVTEGDILLTPSSETEDDIGHAARVSDVPKNVVFSYHLVRFRKGKPADSAYLTYSFNAALIRSYFESVCTGTTRMVLVREDFKNAPMALPPLAEQTAIVEFLDRETGKIDELVAEQRRLMELLKEKRQAVISHAVTRGLNPAAPLKPSGIEWLGDVPTHWTVKRLKHISPFITVGVVVNPSSFVADEGLPFIYGGDIREGVIDWMNSRRIDAKSCDANSKTKLKAGDLLTVRVGAPGVTAVVPPECEGGNCASVMLIRQGDFNSQWLCYAMNTRVVRFQVEVVQYGAAQEQFNIAHAVNFWTPTPPRTEQDEIARFLDTETAKLDTLTAEAQRAIELLQERRTALISAAVTGQIDVRQLAQKSAA